MAVFQGMNHSAHLKKKNFSHKLDIIQEWYDLKIFTVTLTAQKTCSEKVGTLPYTGVYMAESEGPVSLHKQPP